MPGGAFSIPFPPSTNAIWRSVRGRVIKSDRYRLWLRDAGWIVRAQKPKQIDGPFNITIVANRPDRRKRDLDNIAKATLDLLANCQVITNDHLAQSITLRWSDAEPQSGAMVSIQLEAA